MNKLDCFALSMPGANHKANEDSMGIDIERGVFVIADGMGGRPGGAQASRLAVETFIEQLYAVARTKQLDETYLRKAVDAANLKIRKFADSDTYLAGMGTTMTAVVLNGIRGKIVHIGDSRAYIFRESKLVQLTRDHTLVSELIERNLLNPEEAELHPLSHVLSMVLGTQEEVEPDITDLVIRTDEWLVLATDGLQKAVSQVDLTGIIEKYQTRDAEYMCRAIMNVASANELQDDVTVATVKIVGKGENG
jgi:serine/threonine protein phosphatase PrpC